MKSKRKSTGAAKAQTQWSRSLGYLVKLEARLWEVHNKGVSSSSRSIGQYHHEREGEFVSSREWTQIKRLIQLHQLICMPGSGVFGFGFSLTLYQQPEDAPFPGTEGVFRPEYLLSMTHRHMEKVLPKKDKPTFGNDWWDMFEPLVYNQTNLALVKKYKLGPVQTRSYYEY